MVPKLALIERQFPKSTEGDPLDGLRAKLQSAPELKSIRPGQTVAIGVGSRGIAHLKDIVSAVASAVRVRGCEPFVVPCMGSHGGATAEGQIAVLNSLGISEETVGCPLRSGMDTVSLGKTPSGVNVVVDCHAAGADHVIPINRIKPHTDFHGSIQSGLIKMLAIGLGNHVGARQYHHAFAEHGFTKTIRSVYRVVTSRISVPFGVAIVESEEHDTLRAEVVPSGSFLRTERQLLRLASRHLARLPDVPVDLLIVDQIGKEISGSGMDTNVIGLKPNRWTIGKTQPAPLIYLRGLSPETHGNAVGIGLASTIHERILQQVDWPVTYANCLTSGSPRGGAIPVPFKTDHEAMAQLADIVGKDPRSLRVIRIRDTLSLRFVFASDQVIADIRARETIRMMDDASPITFDGEGNFAPDLTPCS